MAVHTYLPVAYFLLLPGLFTMPAYLLYGYLGIVCM